VTGLQDKAFAARMRTTVEKRASTGVWTPGARRKSAHVRCVMSCVTSKKPLAAKLRAAIERQQKLTV
jgi:hypothetical protein